MDCRSPHEPQEAIQLTTQGISALDRFKTTGNDADVEEAILALQRAVDITPRGHPDLSRRLNSLGVSRARRFERTASPDDISQAIACQQKAVNLAPNRQADLPKWLSNLANSLMVRFERMGDLEDISEAVSCMAKAVDLTPEDHPRIHQYLNDLGTSLQYRFEYTGDLDDLSRAISCQQKAVKLTPMGNADLPGGLNNLGCSFSDRFEHTGDLSDLAEAISCHQKAIDLVSEDNEDLPGWLSNLGSCFMHRFRCIGNLGDISEAIVLQRKAVGLTPEGHPHLPGLLNNIGLALMRRFQHTGELTDISEAISALRKAISMTAEDHASLPMRLNNLGTFLQYRFQHTGDLKDISEAIVSQEKAIRLTPEDHADLAMHLGELGNSLMFRFQRLGEFDDITQAISYQQKAVDATPEKHAELPGRLNNLGTLFQTRFEQSGNLADISEAILCQQKAVHLTPEGHPALPGRLNNLGISLEWRYKRTGAITDLSEAISCQEKAASLAPEDHADLPSLLNNLGSSLMHRFDAAGEIADIAKAISSLQRAVDHTPEEHADLPARLSNLGVALMQRFERLRDLDDIVKGISCQRRAVSLAPEDHAELPAWLDNLGKSLKSYFHSEGNLVDLSEAISVLQKAIDLTPEGHANMPLWRNDIASSLMHRFLDQGDRDDIEKAVIHWRQSASSPTGILSVRLTAAKEWAQWSKIVDSSQTVDAYSAIVHLASQIAGLEHTIQKRYAYLMDISELYTSAVAIACEFERYELALEWLEQGRCMVWRQLNNLHTPVDDLRIANPALADEITRVSKALENAGARPELRLFPPNSSMGHKLTLQEEVNIHAKLAQEWDRVLSNVRTIPGFGDFLRPPSCSTLLRQIPVSGAVIVINVHKDRSDALVLMSGHDHPIHIPLPEFSLEKSSHLQSRLNIHLRQSGLRMRGLEPEPVERGMRLHHGRRGAALKEVLYELWNSVVRPIFDRLGFLVSRGFTLGRGLFTNEVGIEDSPSDVRRIWWCNTGPLAFLPIHAAGMYSEKEDITVSDFAICSYIPTVSTLIQNLRTSRAKDEKRPRLFLVSQPDTPTMTPIPGTTKEVRLIEQLIESRGIGCLCLDSSAATIDQGLKGMETHSCIHLACHAEQNTEEPLQSGFYLYDGKLDLLSIIKKQISGADLAFLSACQTSTGDEKLSEEAVHLAAGMLAAGYRGVIATMWSIQDSHGPQIAELFYSNLLGIGGESDGSQLERLSSEGAAHALHSAIRSMRKKLGDPESALLAWVPYVHFGL